MDAIFVRDGETFQPTGRAGSPWGEGLLHGGPPAGLLARAIEQFAVSPGMFVSRLTVDLFRPVPKAPLTVRVRTVRAGNRLHAVEAGIFADDVEVTRATGLVLRMTELEMSAPTIVGTQPAGPEGLEITSMQAGRIPHEKIMRSIELFGEQIIPRFQ